MNIDKLTDFQKSILTASSDDPVPLTVGELRSILVIWSEDVANEFLQKLHPTRFYPQPDITGMQSFTEGATSLLSKFGVKDAPATTPNDDD